jgi:hypothetical protein
LWSAWRIGSVSQSRVKRDLELYWGVQDQHWLTSCLSRPVDPLIGHRDIWAEAKDEPDFRVGNLVALSLNNDPASKAWERWVDQTSFSILEAEHLYEIGGELVRCTYAKRFLGRLFDQSDEDFRPVVARARTVVEEQVHSLETVIKGLSELERELLRGRTRDQRFRDACLVALADWAQNAEPRWGSPRPGANTAHGMWGPLPWWVVTVHTTEQERAVAAAITEGCLPLGYDRDASRPDSLELVCRRPRTIAAPRMQASFAFDLTNPVHLCELLLIGQRGHVCVHAVANLVQNSDEDDQMPSWLGTFRVPVGPELARLLVEKVSRGLRMFLPDEPEPDQGGRLPAFEEALRRIATERLDDASSGRQVLVADTRDHGGLICDIVDPPTTVGALVLSQTSVAATDFRPAAGSYQTEFVYVQHNPAIPGMVKIGFTRQLAEDRAVELSRTAVPFPFEVLYQAATLRAREVERAVHRLMAGNRVAMGREFFRVRPEAAAEAIEYCRELATGIGAWEQMPDLHRLREGDRVTLPLRAGQIFVVTAYPSPFAPEAEPLDMWQAHGDGDILELYVTGNPSHVGGFSDNDLGGTDDPVPYLSRDHATRNGQLLGRERLAAGDRLTWLADQDAELTGHVVFEIEDACQVTYRTWNIQSTADGVPPLLNFSTRELSRAMKVAVRQTLELGPPDTWAPRHPDPSEMWSLPATEQAPPDHWLPQLKPRRPAK